MHTDVKGKKIIVTGGVGFIGSALVHALHEAGASVEALDNLVAGKAERLPEGVVLHEISVLETQKLKEVFSGADAVVHLAALPSVPFSIEHPEEAHMVNVDGTLSVLCAAKAAGVRRVVFASSFAVYGDDVPVPTPEDAVLGPKSPYGLHKQMGEEMCALWASLYGLETVSLRFANAYGPNFDPTGPYASVVGRFLMLHASHEPITVTGDGTQTRDFVHVTDIARAIERALVSENVGKGEIINLGSGVETSVNDIAHMIGGEITYVAPRVEIIRSCADITRARELLGWEPQIALADGIAALNESYGGKR